MEFENVRNTVKPDIVGAKIKERKPSARDSEAGVED